MPLRLQVTFISHHHHREVIFVFHSQHLLVECCDFFKRAPARDTVYQQESLSCTHVLLTHCSTGISRTLLQRRTSILLVLRYPIHPAMPLHHQSYIVYGKNLECVNHWSFACSLPTFNGWVVFVHKMVLTKLDGEGGLAYTPATNNNQFIFPKKLRLRLGVSSHSRHLRQAAMHSAYPCTVDDVPST